MGNIDTFQGRLDGSQRGRLKRLLDMMYKASELAEEIGIPTNHVYRVYIPLGCPHERDAKRYIWINGKVFQEWYLETYKKQKGKPGQGFCLTCKKYVFTINEETKETSENLVYALGNCPTCGRKISRIITQR